MSVSTGSSASENRAAGLIRYREAYEAGRVGMNVHSRSGRDLPAHRPRVAVDVAAVSGLRNQGLSLRMIAKELGLGLGTVVRTLQAVPKLSTDSSREVRDVTGE